LPYSNVTIDPCSGEYLAFDGYIHIVSRGDFDAASGVHALSVINTYQVDGVGLTTGTRYRLIGGSENTVNQHYDPDLANWSATLVQSSRLVSAGAGDNRTVQFTTHLTVAANGEITAQPIEIRVTCGG